MFGNLNFKFFYLIFFMFSNRYLVIDFIFFLVIDFFIGILTSFFSLVIDFFFKFSLYIMCL